MTLNYASTEGSTTASAMTTHEDNDMFLGDVAEKIYEFLNAAGFTLVDVILVLTNGDTVSALD